MILVVGDAMMDIYDHVESTRNAPESPGTPVVTHKSMHMRPGGCLNVARCIEALGEQVSVFTACGSDPTAENLKNLVDDMQVEWFGGTGETTCKTRVMLGTDMLLRYDIDRESEQDYTLAALENEVITELETGHVKCLVLSDYGKGVLAQPQKMIQVANRHGIPVIVDPKGSDWTRYDGCDVIKPNKSELMKPSTMYHVSDYVLETRGADGMVLGGPDIFETVNGVTRNSVDPTGAGDQVIAALAVFYGVKKWGLLNAARIANVIASKSTEYEGVRPITMEECREECRKYHVAVPV